MRRTLAFVLLAACGEAPAAPEPQPQPPAHQAPPLTAPLAIEERRDPESDVSITIHVPADRAGWSRVDLRRARGPRPPECDSGGIIATFDLFEGDLVAEPDDAQLGDSYRACVYGVGESAPGASAALAGVRHIPFARAERRGCALDGWIQADPVDDDLASIALVVEPAPDQDAEPTIACVDGHVATEIDRSVFDGLVAIDGESVRNRVSIDGFSVRVPVSIELPCDAAYAYRVCGRDRDGALVGLESGELAVEDAFGSADPVTLSPSGPVALTFLQPGHTILAWDPSSSALVTTTIRRVDWTAGPSVVLRLEGGRESAVGAARPVWLPERGELVRASELAVGDVVFTDALRPARIVAIDRANGSAVPVDVDWPDTFFENGILVGDHRPSPRPSEIPIAAIAREDVMVRGAELSYDCMLHLHLEVARVPPEAVSVALVVGPDHDARGRTSEMGCRDGRALVEIPRAALDALRAAQRTSVDVELPGYEDGEDPPAVDPPIECSTPYAVLACVRDASGALAAMPGARARWALAGATCFAAGTPIATPEGPVAIEQLGPGQRLLAWNVERDRREVVRAMHLRAHPHRRIASLLLSSGAILRVTDEHPMWDPVARRFRLAGELGIGDTLLAIDGALVRVLARIDVGERATVYDLSVSGPHTYFADGVLAHNY